MSLHSSRPPSSASRWVPCPLSIPLERANPEIEQTQDAKDGDAAHWVGAETLRGLRDKNPRWSFKAGMPAPNGVILTDEIIDSAITYTDYVIEQVGSDALDKIFIEERVASPAIHPDFWGTCDVFWFSLGVAGGYIDVMDFKNGHRYVDPFENWQLIGYLACILSRPEFANIPRGNIKVRLHVVQPRNFHPSGPCRVWETTADKMGIFFGKLSTSAHDADAPNPIGRVNEECRDCRGRHQCAVLQNGADAAMEFAGALAPIDLTPEAMGIELRMLQRAEQMLKARRSGLEEQVISKIKNSVRVPYFGLGSADGRLKWTKDAADVFMVADAMGIDIRKPAEPITPTQAIKAGLDESLVKGFAARTKGALQLITQDDATARKVFSK